MSEKIKIHVIKEKTFADIQVSSEFYGRLSDVYFNFTHKLGEEKTEELCTLIAEKKSKEAETDEDKRDLYTIETLLIMMNGIESKFQADGNIIEKEIDPTSED